MLKFLKQTNLSQNLEHSHYDFNWKWKIVREVEVLLEKRQYNIVL